MATIKEIMAGLRTSLSTIDGLNVVEVTPGQITVPAAVVGLPGEVDYLRTFTDQNIDLVFNVWVVTSTAVDFAGQQMLAEYMDKQGLKSILAALGVDKTLGGVVDYAELVSCVPQMVDFNGVNYYGALFTVAVAASGGA